MERYDDRLHAALNLRGIRDTLYQFVTVPFCLLSCLSLFFFSTSPPIIFHPPQHPDAPNLTHFSREALSNSSSLSVIHILWDLRAAELSWEDVASSSFSLCSALLSENVFRLLHQVFICGGNLCQTHPSVPPYILLSVHLGTSFNRVPFICNYNQICASASVPPFPPSLSQSLPLPTPLLLTWVYQNLRKRRK